MAKLKAPVSEMAALSAFTRRRDGNVYNLKLGGLR
jgi:hypothetical protein